MRLTGADARHAAIHAQLGVAALYGMQGGGAVEAADFAGWRGNQNAR